MAEVEVRIDRPCIPHLQLLILAILERRGPLCGYRVYRILEEYGLASQPGAVYSALRKLSEKGYVVKTGEGRRGARYAVTEEGRRELSTLLAILGKLLSALEELGVQVPRSETTIACVGGGGEEAGVQGEG